MRSILVLLEDIVREEFGANDLAKVRAVAAERFEDVANGTGPAGRVAAFVRAISEVRRRPLPEVYTFVGMRLTETVVKDFPMKSSMSRPGLVTSLPSPDIQSVRLRACW